MSRVSNALNMAIMLMNRQKMSIKELSERLEVSESMIRKYRDDLELAGIYIDSTRGKNGGYQLNSSNPLIGLNISDEEVTAINMSKEYLRANNFIYSKEIEILCDKIDSLKNHRKVINDNINYFSKNSKTNCNYQTERKKYIEIIDAIINKRKLKIKYFSLQNGLTERIVRPYATFDYKGDTYLAGFCEYRKMVRDFKLLRIKEYQVLDEEFELPVDFNLKEILKDCIGIYKDKEVDITLKIEGNMAHIVSEKIWVDNQKITWIDNNTIIFKAQMRGITEIKSWILSMGSSAKVLEPKILKDDIFKEIEKMKEKNL